MGPKGPSSFYILKGDKHIVFERLRKNVAKTVGETLREETIKSLDDIMPVLVGFTSVIGLCIGVFGKSNPIGTTITINNFYYGRK